MHAKEASYNFCHLWLVKHFIAFEGVADLCVTYGAVFSSFNIHAKMRLHKLRKKNARISNSIYRGLDRIEDFLSVTAHQADNVSSFTFFKVEG